MGSIIWMLIVAWFLDLFGFSNIVINGICQLGGPEMGVEAYYLIFALIGALKNLANCLHNSGDVNLKIEPINKDKNEKNT